MPKSTDSLFTIIMEYRGGTYIAQVVATNPQSALKSWASQLNPIDIGDFGEAQKRELVDAIDEWLTKRSPAAAIMGAVNVWCRTETIGGFSMLIHIVATKKRVAPHGYRRASPGRS